MRHDLRKSLTGLLAWLRAGRLGPAYVDPAHPAPERALTRPPG